MGINLLFPRIIQQTFFIYQPQYYSPSGLLEVFSGLLEAS